MTFKTHLIAAGFALFAATRLHRLAGDFFRGRGVILTFHRIRPAESCDFAPNRLLEITPEFFDRVLTLLRENGLEIIGLDAAAARLRDGGAPFAVLTFDDGFRDVLTHALPVLERHEAPFACYIAPGFADHTARLWWVELEEAIRRLDGIDFELGGARLSLHARTGAEKGAAFQRLYGLLRKADEDRLMEAIARLGEKAGVDSRALIASLCLDWSGLRVLAANPLATLGAHTLTHPRLSALSEHEAVDEMVGGRDRLELELGLKCRHFAYPYGDSDAAGPREFALAERLGFATAVTTRPGMIFPQHAGHLLALPRLSVNGLWQQAGYFEALLSGTPFALWNRGRRVNVD